MFLGGKLMEMMDLDWSFTALLPVVFLHLRCKVQDFSEYSSRVGFCSGHCLRDPRDHHGWQFAEPTGLNLNKADTDLLILGI